MYIKCQTVLIDTIRCNNFGLDWTWDQWQLRGTPHFPKLQLLLEPHYKIV